LIKDDRSQAHESLLGECMSSWHPRALWAGIALNCLTLVMGASGVVAEPLSAAFTYQGQLTQRARR
jgi:hypothetical protein